MIYGLRHCRALAQTECRTRSLLLLFEVELVATFTFTIVFEFSNSKHTVNIEWASCETSRTWKWHRKCTIRRIRVEFTLFTNINIVFYLLILSFATFMTQLWRRGKGLAELEAIFCVSFSFSLSLSISSFVISFAMSSCVKTNYPKTKIICENVRDSYSFTASIAS